MSSEERAPVRSKTTRFPAPLVVTSVLALAVGVGAAIAVSRLVDRPGIAATPAAAQYLPPVSQQSEVAPDFSLPDQGGRNVSLSSLRGKEVLITFLDPLCTSQCPILGQQIGTVEAGLPANVKPVLLIVSVAANRSAADVAAFTSHVTWQPGWHWLLGNQAQLQAVWALYNIAVQPSTGDVLHDETLFVVNPQGRITTGYNAPLPITEVASTITQSSR